MKIILKGQPLAKKRARTYTSKKGVHTFDPQFKEKNSAKWMLKSEICQQRQPDILPTPYPVCIRLKFFIQPLNDSPNRNLKLLGLFPNTGRKDLDNLEKFILDAGNGILYEDDSQIIQIHSSKHWSDDPRTEIDMTINEPFPLTDNEKKIINLFSPKEFTHLEKIIDDIDCEMNNGDIDFVALANSLKDLSLHFADKFIKIKKIAQDSNE